MAKRKIHEFNFQKDGAHVALVDKAANLQEVLTLKAEDEVQVTLSMRNFLTKFFDMWCDDAEILAGVLGYEVSNENDKGTVVSYDDFIRSRIDSIQLLKSEVPETLPLSIATKVIELEKEFSDIIEAGKTPADINPEGEIEMEKAEISVEELEVLKAAAQQVEELQKSINDLKADKQALEAVAAEKAKNEMTEVVKGYSFVQDQEALVEFLLKSEGSDVVLLSLEKARDAINAAVTVEAGNAQDVVVEETTEKSAVVSSVENILKARKA